MISFKFPGIKFGLISHDPCNSEYLRIVDKLKYVGSLESRVEVIIPTLNEEKTIASIIKRAFMYAKKVIVIDGWSEDATVDIAEKMGAKTILQNGRGKGAALKDVIKYVSSDIIVFIDGDGSMKPEEIPIFINGICSGADLVKGSRFVFGGSSQDITFLRRFGNTLFTILINVIWKSNFTDTCYGYMAIRKDALKKIGPNLHSKGFDIETEIIIKSKKLGLKIIEVPSIELKRMHGESKLKTFQDGWKILTTILREFFFPLVL